MSLLREPVRAARTPDYRLTLMGQRISPQVGARLQRLRLTYASEKDALAAAQSEWQRLQRGRASFTLDLAEGRPESYPETPVALSGWKREIDSTAWLITEVSHDLSDNGYTCSLLFERHSV